jgi:cell wall-associated NlpC family hydrolase
MQLRMRTPSVPAAHRNSRPCHDPERSPDTATPGRSGVRSTITLLLAVALIGGVVTAMGGLASAATRSSCGGSVASQAVCQAKKQLGKRYVWGGKGPSVFDCSGLTHYVYQKAGFDWSYYTAAGQYQRGVQKKWMVSTSHLVPGDLVFFNWDGGEIDHVGLYIGGNRMIHASYSAGKVMTTALSRYYLDHMMKSAVRLGGQGGHQPSTKTSKADPTGKPKPTKTKRPSGGDHVDDGSRSRGDEPDPKILIEAR